MIIFVNILDTGGKNMKNFKIYKSALALITSTSILLLCGCGSNANKENKTKSAPCTHLTIYFADEPITFKECGGYDISVNRYNTSGEIGYVIEKENKILFNGVTSNYNNYTIYHDFVDDITQNESIKKLKDSILHILSLLISIFYCK